MPFALHNISNEPEAAETLRSRGIKSVPVAFVGDQTIIGFDPTKLFGLLGLAHSGGTGDRYWLADRYERILGLAVSVTKQLTDEHLAEVIPQRRSTLRAHLLHIYRAVDMAERSHITGCFSITVLDGSVVDKDTVTVEQVIRRGDEVRASVAKFLRTAPEKDLARVVDSFYGGEVPVLEVLHIILGHSTHHLKQAQWLLGQIGVTVKDPVTAKDMEGVITPVELF